MSRTDRVIATVATVMLVAVASLLTAALAFGFADIWARLGCRS